jgi:hypothetical protein
MNYLGTKPTIQPPCVKGFMDKLDNVKPPPNVIAKDPINFNEKNQKNYKKMMQFNP